MTAPPDPQPAQQPRPEVSDAELRASARRLSEICRRFLARVEAERAAEATASAAKNDETT